MRARGLSEQSNDEILARCSRAGVRSAAGPLDGASFELVLLNEARRVMALCPYTEDDLLMLCREFRGYGWFVESSPDAPALIETARAAVRAPVSPEALLKAAWLAHGGARPR